MVVITDDTSQQDSDKLNNAKHTISYEFELLVFARLYNSSKLVFEIVNVVVVEDASFAIMDTISGSNP